MEKTSILYQLKIGDIVRGNGEPAPVVEHHNPTDILDDKTVAEIGKTIAALDGVRAGIREIVESGRAMDPQTGKEVDHEFGQNPSKDQMILEVMLAKAVGQNVAIRSDLWV